MDVSGSDLMAEYNFVSKYPKYLPDLNRRETFVEANDRVLDMHMQKYVYHFDVNDPVRDKLVAYINRSFDLVKDKRVLGSQRTLQFAGEGILKHENRGYNCSFSYCDRPRFFAEVLYLLLCGVGGGLSVQRHHVAQLPFLRNKEEGSYSFIIKDTIEGWADALNELVYANMLIADENGYSHEVIGGMPRFDYSLIRPIGSPLSTGGRAPGPEPLKLALEKIQGVFDKARKNKQLKLTPLQCLDITCYASDSVLSAGVRRSALIALFSPDDEEMMNAKVGNWQIDNGQRARCNNTAVLLRNEDNLSDFKRLVKASREFGEPGFAFLASTEYGLNACAEISLCPLLVRDPIGNIVENYSLDLIDYKQRDNWIKEGYTFESGWEFCNLSSVNASKAKTKEEFKEAVWAAAVIGTLQAGYTKFNYLTGVSQLINEREALLGVSIAGIMDNPAIALDYDFQREMALFACDVNKEVAEMIGIRPAARVTCVKPDGNTAVILNTSSGIHPHHARRYIRRVQTTKQDTIYQYFKSLNPHMCEDSVWSANKTDDVIAFPVVTKPGSVVMDDLSATDFLEAVLNTQKNWVRYGTARPFSCEGAIHNVSNTVSVGSNEWMEVGKFIYENKEYFTAVSVVGKSADYVYPQAPRQRIVFEDELVEMYGKVNVGAAKHLHRHIDSRFGGLQSVLRPLKMVLEGYTSEEAVKGLNIHSELLWDTYKRVLQLVHLKEPDDIIFLLSAINHEEIWNGLLLNMKEVDYLNLIEVDDNTKQVDAVACGNGMCEI